MNKQELLKLKEVCDSLRKTKDAYTGKIFSAEEFAKFIQNAKVYLNEAESAWKNTEYSKATGYISEAEKQISQLWKKIHG